MRFPYVEYRGGVAEVFGQGGHVGRVIDAILDTGGRAEEEMVVWC